MADRMVKVYVDPGVAKRIEFITGQTYEPGEVVREAHIAEMLDILEGRVVVHLRDPWQE